MATPFRRPYVSWRVVSSIGELRGCTISGTRQHAGQAIAPIPRSSGDGPVEIQRRPISAFSKSISLYDGWFTIKERGRCRRGLGCTEYMVTRRGSRQPAFRVNSLRIPCILSPPHIVMFASTTSACLLAPVALHALFARRRLSGQAGGQRLSSPRPSSSPWAYSGGWCSTHAPALNDDNGDAN